MHFKTTFAIKYVQIQFFYRKAQNVKYNRHIIGERSEPHTYRTVGKNLRHIYIYIYMFFIYIYIYIYTTMRRARAVNARRANVGLAG